MYHYIKGIITQTYDNYIVLENNNIGYLIKTFNPYSYKIGDEILLYTYLHVREDLMELYGFKTQAEKDLFLKLISVKGIGPKGALAIIANDDVQRLEQAIINSDAKYLQKFPGIGQKASSQIILDLQGKLIVNNKPTNPKFMKVKEALKSLGYKDSELKKLNDFLKENEELPIAELVKQSLKKLI